MNEPGFLEKAKAAHTLAEAAKLAKEKRVRDEALGKHFLNSGNIDGFQEPAAAPPGLVEVPDPVLAVQEVESRWHEKQIPAARDQHYTGGPKRPGGVKRKQIEVPAEVAVDQPEGWKESKKRKGEGGRPVTKGVAGFANLSAYKEKYRSLLKANGWGVGGRVMPKNSWSSWQEAVKSLLEILGKQRVHQMTGGSNVGGVGGTDRADRQEEGDAEEEEAEEAEEEEEEDDMVIEAVITVDAVVLVTR